MKLTTQPLRTQLRISVHDIRIGMFIAELDRPWTETPFLMQGFLLDDTAHLATLRDFVAEVVIDPSRSTTDALAHLPWDALHLPPAATDERAPVRTVAAASVMHVERASRRHVAGGGSSTAPPTLLAALWQDLRASLRRAPQGLPQPALQQYYLRYAAPEGETDQDAGKRHGASQTAEDDASKATRASSLTPPSTPGFSQFIAALYPREVGFSLPYANALVFWWHRNRARRSKAASRRTPTLRPARARPDFLPPNMPLLVYHDQSTLAEEATRARAVVQRAESVLAGIASDVQANLPIDIAGVQPIVDVLVDSVISNPDALIWSTRLHDESRMTYLHGLKVAIYMMALGRHLGFPREQLAELSSIGLLLDVGMLKIPAALLAKSEALTAEENALLVGHVAYSIEALEQKAPLPRHVARGILEHHERIDGSGYPQGLAGDAISIYGRMAAIADTFAAMTTARPYDVTHSAFDAMKELFREAEHKLHAPLVEQFVQAISIFPVGSLIELSTGEVAIVLEHNGVRRLEPKILVLTDAEKNLLTQPFSMELMGTGADRRKILRGLADGAYGIDYRDYYLN